MRRNALASLVAWSVVGVGLPASNAGTHVVINPDLLKSPREKAFLDVACEPGSAVTYNVYFPLGQPQQEVVPMTDNNNATSPDLFEMSGGHTGLVIAATNNPATPSVALLRQELRGGLRQAVTIPSVELMMGTSFSLPLGELWGDDVLYVGNPSGTDAHVVIQHGSSTLPAAARATVGPLGVETLPLTQGGTNVLVTVTNGVQVVCMAVVGKRLLVVLPIF